MLIGLNDLNGLDAEFIWTRHNEAASTRQGIELDEDGDIVVARRNSKLFLMTLSLLYNGIILDWISESRTCRWKLTN